MTVYHYPCWSLIGNYVTDIVFIDDLVMKAHEKSGQNSLEELTQANPQRLRNREAPLNVWIWKANV